MNRMRAMTLNESGEYSEDTELLIYSVLEKLRKFERKQYAHASVRLLGRVFSLFIGC